MKLHPSMMSEKNKIKWEKHVCRGFERRLIVLERINLFLVENNNPIITIHHQAGIKAIISFNTIFLFQEIYFRGVQLENDHSKRACDHVIAN